ITGAPSRPIVAIVLRALPSFVVTASPSATAFVIGRATVTVDLPSAGGAAKIVSTEKVGNAEPDIPACSNCSCPSAPDAGIWNVKRGPGVIVFPTVVSYLAESAAYNVRVSPDLSKTVTDVRISISSCWSGPAPAILTEPLVEYVSWSPGTRL